ncbi:MAG: F0F1 ATP synthase subunit B [Bacteroidales bacterium]|jgi:F-type H+-transporting ATPase subunit b|nr:F0F1 ATP synthase subunit B [Bacteroidales bacterium]
MSLLTPDLGLVFWMLIAFGIVVLILTKFAFPPIIKGVENRNKFIDESLAAAKQAQEDLKNVKADGEKILEQAKKEQAKILAEAVKSRETIIRDAMDKAQKEADVMIGLARKQIEAEKNDAIRDIRKEVVNLSFDIAEKILRKNLDQKAEQEAVINQLIDDMNVYKS